MADDKKEKKVIMLPEGRLINSSFFEMDTYVDKETGKEGKPSYKVEMTYDPVVLQSGKDGDFEEECANFAADLWGEPWFNKFMDGEVIGPWKDGNILHADRVARGKEGDAYKGKLVLRASTIFNQFGQEGPGGIFVCDEDAKPITGVNKNLIFPGMYGLIGVTLHGYTDKGPRGEPLHCLKCFLEGFQRTRDGEKLVTGKDRSQMFKPVGRAAGAAPTERRRRPG